MAKTDFLTPVGRMVQGDPFEAQTKDQQGNALTIKSGPNMGQPTQRYFIAVAFRKDDPNFPPFYAKLAAQARADWPQLFDAAGNCTHPRFSWKLADGDGVDDNGKQNSSKEGFAGHWVVKFGSSFAPRCFHAGHYAPHEQIQDRNAIQRGYFVRVAGTIEGNGIQQKPGLYVNLSMVELAGVGPIISSGPDASAVFGGAAPVLPAGASPLPMHAATPGLPQMPGVAAAPAPLPGVGAVPGLPSVSNGPAMMPGAALTPGAGIAPMSPSSPALLAVPPNPAFLAGPGGVPGVAAPVAGTYSPPPAPVAIAPPAPPSSPAMTALAGGATYEQFIAQGWTPEAMRASGYLA
jgi:hypothetical protein